MRKFLLSTLILILTAINLKGQSDSRAVSILDQFAAAATSAPSVSMNFLLITVDQVENYADTLAGSIILNKDRYKLELPDNIVWYDGKTSWSYLPAEQEVTITNPEDEGESFQSRPSMIFTMYKTGFKCRLLEDRKDSYIIDLYPEDIKHDLIRVRLTIEKPSLKLRNFEYKRRDGITLTLIVNDYNLKTTPEESLFTFSPSKYKGVEIIDMR
ncbi:MAG: LolA family protein [Bacteroidales bacterium]|jgi:outer membrane lipoprotein-sorting protein